MKLVSNLNGRVDAMYRQLPFEEKAKVSPSTIVFGVAALLRKAGYDEYKHDSGYCPDNKSSDFTTVYRDANSNSVIVSADYSQQTKRVGLFWKKDVPVTFSFNYSVDADPKNNSKLLKQIETYLKENISSDADE